jgi:hypothetical protein
LTTSIFNSRTVLWEGRGEIPLPDPILFNQTRVTIGTPKRVLAFAKEVVPYQKERKMTIIIKSSSDKATIQEILGRLATPKKFDAFKYCGVFKLQTSPLEIQKALRDEWE